MRYGDLTFDEGLLLARRGEDEVRFTRQERALLLAFTANAGRLMRRDQLLDVLSHDGGEMSDRNVDFLVNRLRGKLGDDARAPRFIATQYGEGYVWIATPETERPVSATLVVGPLFGLGNDGPGRQARSVVETLARRLAGTLRDGSVLVAEAWRGPGAADDVRYFLECSFFDRGATLHCGAVLRKAPAGQIVRAFRLRFETGDAGAHDRETATLADALAATLWGDMTAAAGAGGAPSDPPLELLVHDASALLSAGDRAWLAGGDFLARARENDPDDPRIALMWCMHLYARLVLASPFAPVTREARNAAESEIEALVLGQLSAARRDPVLSLAAAKLLFFIDRGHLALAETLAEGAFERGTAFGAAFATIGQLQAARGRFDEALRYHDLGLELAGDGSEFAVYLLLLKCTALLAAGERGPLDALRAQLHELRPESMAVMDLFMAPPGRPLPAPQRALLDRLGARGTRALIDYHYDTSARHFVDAGHRDNVMACLLVHARGRFGDALRPAGRGEAAAV